MKKRARIEILFDILTIISDNDGKMLSTRLLQKANLSSQQLTAFTEALMSRGYVVNQLEPKASNSKLPWPHFVITTKGNNLLQDMQVLKQIEELFNF